MRHAKEIIGPYPSFARSTPYKNGHPYLKENPIAAVQGPAAEGEILSRVGPSGLLMSYHII